LTAHRFSSEQLSQRFNVHVASPMTRFASSC